MFVIAGVLLIAPVRLAVPSATPFIYNFTLPSVLEYVVVTNVQALPSTIIEPLEIAVTSGLEPGLVEKAYLNFPEETENLYEILYDESPLYMIVPEGEDGLIHALIVISDPGVGVEAMFA